MTVAEQMDGLWAGLNDPDTGQSYAGAIIGFFEAGTTTAKAVWYDRDMTLPSAAGVTQVTLDSNGQAKVFGRGTYKINIYAPTDTLLTTPLSNSVDGAEFSAGTALSNAEIKAGYEANADTNAYTDAEQTKVGYLTVTGAVDLDTINTNVGLNNTHRTSNGSDHTYIDQSVISGATPTFTGTNFTGIPTGGLLDDAVTYAKIQNIVANNVLLGNDNGAGSAVQELSASDAKTLLAIAASDLTATGTPDANTYLRGDNTWQNLAGATVSDTAYTRAGWNGDTTIAPSKNACSDAFYNMVRYEDADTGGTDNTLVGETGNTTNTGIYNIFAGNGAGASNTTANNCTFVGYNTGNSNTTGSNCTFVGRAAGFSNTEGLRNLFMGYEAGYANIDGDDNVGIGYDTLRAINNSAAIKNTAVGNYSGDALTQGYEWTAVGYNAATAATTGFGGISIGSESGGSVTTADDTISIGRGISASNADNRLAIGRDSDGNAFMTGTMTGSSGSVAFRGTPYYLNCIGTSIGLGTNGSFSIEFTNGTTITFRGRDGSGVERTGTVTLS